MAEFILMLTRDDLTIPDAGSVYGQISGLGVRHVGCKDIGIPRDQLRALIQDIREHGHTSHLEVVSDTREETLRSAEAAVEIEPDYLIGGTLIQPIQELIGGTSIKFFPYVGRIIGHPCLLRGSIADICDDVIRAEAAGVDGINLLAYRYDGDVPALVTAVLASTELPVICAGSIASIAQIRALDELGVWGFTVGTAILDRQVVANGSLEEQIQAVLAAAG